MARPTGRFTAQQWRRIYLGIALGLVAVAIVLAIVRPADVVTVSVLMGLGLVVPVSCLLGYLSNRPHVWLHLAMLFVLMFESAILAGIVNGLPK